MADWILYSEDAAQQYHAVYQTFVDTVFESGWFEQELTRVIDMIAPYVKADPTAFCTYEEFETAADTLLSFCMKRAESAARQLSGELAATSARQETAKRVDASDLNLSAMGSMGNMGGGGFPGGDFSREKPGSGRREPAKERSGENGTEGSCAPPDGGKNAAGFDPGNIPDGFAGFTPPDGFAPGGGTEAANAQALPMLALCIVTLLAALVLAKRFKLHQ